MTSFTIFGNDTTAETLAAGESGFVSLLGTLYTQAATAVTINGSASLTVMGTVATSTGLAAVRAPTNTATDISITVGAQGSILSAQTDAIRIIASQLLQVTNGGLISGTTAIFMQGVVAGNTPGRVVNTGTITASQTQPAPNESGVISFGSLLGTGFVNNSGRIIGEGANYAITHANADAMAIVRNTGEILARDIAISATRSLDLQNDGTIQGAVSADDVAVTNAGTISVDTDTIFGLDSAITAYNVLRLDNSGTITGVVTSFRLANIDNAGQIVGSVVIDDALFLRNSGEISGNVNTGTFDATYGAEIVNTGRIGGQVNMGTEDDVFVNAGGTVGGVVRGNLGNDTYTIDRSDIVIIDTSGTSDTVYSSVSYQTGEGIDILYLTGSVGLAGTGRGGNERIFGTDLNDTLRGGAGNDTLQGNDGDDTVIGGTGDDRLLGGDGGDVVRGGDGSDTLVFSGGSDTLEGGSGRDRLEVSGFTQGVVASLTTNLANVINGDGEITDQATLSGIEDIIGSALGDTLTGGNGANLLDGRDGADALNGGNGNDTLIGGAGRDTLTGGGNADTFVFTQISDSAAGSGDLIVGFQRTVDIIDLEELYGDQNAPVDVPFFYRGTGAFTGGGPEVRYVDNTLLGTTTIEIRFDGSIANDMEITLNAVVALTSSNFIL